MADAHANFAYSTVLSDPQPAGIGNTLTVQSGEGALFPTPPFNATVWPINDQPSSANAEIVRVTAINGDVFTIERRQEGSYSRDIQIGDQIAATITNKVLVDAEDTMSTWTPFIMHSGAHSGLQTLASNSSQNTTASVFLFPVTVPDNIQFNRILLMHSFSVVTSATATTANNSYNFKFGLYSMNNATALSLIASNSFSIGETINSNRLSWNFPTTTATSGYGYGGFPAGSLTTSGQISSYVSGTRAIAMQFGRNIYMSSGIYHLGILTQRQTSVANNYGLSHAGIVGHVINPLNIMGSVSGPNPIGIAATQWSGNQRASHSTGWWGRHMVGFISATSITNQAGSAIPSSIALSAMGAVAAASTGTIIPSVTFYST